MRTQHGTVKIGAKYSGKCRCQARFVAGAWIVWDTVLRKVVACEACLPVSKTKSGAVVDGPARTISEPFVAPPDVDPPGSDPFELKD